MASKDPEYASKYYQKNKEKLSKRKYDKKWHRDYYVKNREKMIAYAKQRHIEHPIISTPERIAKTKEWVKNNPLKVRDKRLKRHYGISLEQYEAMIKLQNGVCCICLKPEMSLSKNGKIKSLAVDHNHKTGIIRGLLCHRCNIALGGFMDDIDSLKRAIYYLENN